MEGGKIGGQPRQDVGAGNGAGGNDNRAGDVLADGGELIFEFFQVIEDRQGPRVEEIRLEGGDDRPAEAVEKPAVEPIFEIADVFADRRLAGVELFGGPGEASVFIDSDEYFQVSSFYLGTPVVNLFQVGAKHGI